MGIFQSGNGIDFFSCYKKSLSNSSSLLNTFQEKKAVNSEFAKIGIGNSEGEMVFETNFFGKIISSPLGGAANEAVKMAKDLAIAY